VRGFGESIRHRDGLEWGGLSAPGIEGFGERTTIAATRPLAAGRATIRFEFAYEGGGQGKGGTGTLFVNGEKVAEGRIERTQTIVFSADETADVGIDLATPVVEAIGSEARSPFTGRIREVKVQVN
jgi:arylsulfatase